MSETEAGLRAAITAAPDDFGLYGLLGDCLAEGGDEALAEGYWAMHQLRVRPDRGLGSRHYFPLDTCSAGLSASPRTTVRHAVEQWRAGGEFQFVTAAWFYAAFRLCGGKGLFTDEPGDAWESPASMAEATDLIARGWVGLSADEKAEAVALLGEPRAAPEVSRA